MDQLFGCIEAGGTKFMLGVADGDGVFHAKTRMATTTPAETLTRVTTWLGEVTGGAQAFTVIGIASFGPLDLDPTSPGRGRIMRTAKPGWSGTDMVTPFARVFGCPVAIDTDVNGAALAESLWGAARGADVSAYVTVGTGIGGGAIVHGAPLHGFGHPEMGHFRPQRHPADAGFAGICPFHGDCLEGLASGSAIAARSGGSLSELPEDHPTHMIVACYLAQLCISLRAILAPRVIVMGGGVMNTPGLLARIRDEVAVLGGDYFPGDGKAIILPAGLGAEAGLRGALALAQRAAG